MEAHVELPSSTRYVDGWLGFPRYTSMHYLNGWCRIVAAVNSPMRVDAQSCRSVFGTSDSKYYRRQSLWVEWRRVWHCPTNWWAFLYYTVDLSDITHSPDMMSEWLSCVAICLRLVSAVCHRVRGCQDRFHRRSCVGNWCWWTANTEFSRWLFARIIWRRWYVFSSPQNWFEFKYCILCYSLLPLTK